MPRVIAYCTDCDTPCPKSSISDPDGLESKVICFTVTCPACHEETVALAVLEGPVIVEYNDEQKLLIVVPLQPEEAHRADVHGSPWADVPTS